MKRFKFVILAVVMITGVALGVHLMHKDALALNAVWEARIDWGDPDNIDDADVIMTIKTYNQLGVIIDSHVMSYSYTDGVISYYIASFQPNANAVTWRVFATPSDMFNPNMVLDDENVNGALNVMDDDIHWTAP
jgi:hypothetical protein